MDCQVPQPFKNQSSLAYCLSINSEMKHKLTENNYPLWETFTDILFSILQNNKYLCDYFNILCTEITIAIHCGSNEY